MNCRKFALLIWMIAGIFLVSGLSHAQGFYVKNLEQQWVYDAMAVFAQEGYIKNYPKEWIKSGNELSRFEIAYYIKQFVESSSRLTRKNKTQLPEHISKIIRKLMVEFEGELTALGIKTADIARISPNLTAPVQNNKPTDYQDLDTVLNPKSSPNPLNSMPFYYFGQYYNAYQRKSFIFLPADHLNSGDFDLLEDDINGVNIVYQMNMGEKQLFLVVKGNLPLTDQKLLTGYFMFPINGPTPNGLLFQPDLNQTVLALLEEVNQLKQIENLWCMEGVLPLKGYTKLDTGIQKSMLFDRFNQGIKIGSTLIFSDAAVFKSNYESNHFGLPSYAPRSGSVSEWDLFNTNLDSYQINIQGKKSLSNHTSVFGGIDLLYTQTRNRTLFESLFPPKTKYSAGVDYQMNDLWTLLSYQSFVNMDTERKNELLSTTSFGVEYNDWITLWLAYQMLDFKSDQKLTGVISIRF